MAEVLRPMSTGELMDRTFTLYRRNFKLFVGIATVGPATYLLFQLLTVGSVAVPATTGRVGAFGAATLGVGGVLAGVVIMLAGWAIAHAATVKAVAAVHLGHPITIGGAYKSLKGRVWRILAVFLCIMLLLLVATFVAGLGIVIVTAIVAAMSTSVGAQTGRAGAIVTFLIGFGAILVVGIFAILVWVRYALAIAACVVEDLGVIASLHRSTSLSKGSRFRLFIVYIVFFILAMVVGVALGGLAGGIAALIPNVTARFILIYLVSFVVGSLTGPLATIGIALVYYDERVRKEAFDLQLMMASLGALPPVPPVPAAVQP